MAALATANTNVDIFAAMGSGKKAAEKNIHVKVYGERNTGTNYLCQLLEHNLEVVLLPGVVPQAFDRENNCSEAARDRWFAQNYNRNLGWKHALGPRKAQLVEARIENLYFITLSKNPYAWLLSMYRRPYHNKAQAASFEAFLEQPWPAMGRENGAGSFANPAVLWNEKNRSYIKLQQYAQAAHLSYEELLANPAGAIGRLADRWKLPRRHASFQNVSESTKQDEGKDFDYYKRYYLEEQWRTKLSPAALAMINAWLNPGVMASCGYALVWP